MKAPTEGVFVNDVHSRLNATRVARIEQPRSLDKLCRVVRDADAVSICGGRHAMGGQQFGAGTVLVDLSEHARIHALDAERGLVKVDAGVRWPALVAGLHSLQAGQTHGWGIRQKQTGADELSLGGSLAVNAHGRGLRLPPMVSDVEAFTLVDVHGEARVCSRRENTDLFGLAIGGYGAFGMIADVTLRLVPRRKLQRRVKLVHAAELIAAFDERIAAGYEYGDFQFNIDEHAPDFLQRGVFSCYRPVEDNRQVPPDQPRLGAEDWGRLLLLAHTDRRRAFEEYCRYYLSTDGQLYWSDTHQLTTYLEGYHHDIDHCLHRPCPGSEVITELYVPRARLAEFLARAAESLRARRAAMIYGTVRLVERDTESFLAWAHGSFACVIFNLHVDHQPAALEEAAGTFRALIDLAIDADGSFYLTYHRWATREQVEACYPQFARWLSLQRQHDPAGRWQNDWLRHMRKLFQGCANTGRTMPDACGPAR